MTFERTRNPFLIAEMIRRSFDRPAMYSEGANPAECPPLSDQAQYFAVRDGLDAIGLLIGIQTSPVAIDLHVCLTPECRGRRAIEASREFLAWLGRETPYHVATGAIPAYNRAMLFVAHAAGMRDLAVSKNSTMRKGKLEDRVIVERQIK